VTHLYTILVRGTVLPGRDAPPVSAIAWAGDTVIGLGSEADVRAMSRGDSDFVDLAGAFVVPLGLPGDAVWPPAATLEIGDRADLAIVADDPRLDDPGARAGSTIALIRDGVIVAGRLPRSINGRTPSRREGHHDQ
jgi:predicted amidohydrolase YtcJ